MGSTVLTADAEGTITLDADNSYYLRLRLPPLHLDRLTAKFFAADRLVLIVAPMLLDDLTQPGIASSPLTRIPIAMVDGKCTEQFDSNNELDIAHEPRPGAPPSPSPKNAAKKATSEAERLNIEQTTYASLYKEIGTQMKEECGECVVRCSYLLLLGSAAGAHPAVSQPLASKATAAPAAIKVGRNDPCPCGTGKKYKQCHGKNA